MPDRKIVRFDPYVGTVEVENEDLSHTWGHLFVQENLNVYFRPLVPEGPAISSDENEPDDKS